MAHDRPLSSRDNPLGIADAVRLAHRTLDGLGLVWLEGEVMQATTPASGHLYFTLHDRGSVLAAVLWSRDAARQRVKIEPGRRVRVRGRLGVYDRDGKMQLYVDFAEPAGAGAEAIALDQLRRKLTAEGLFAAERKRALPRFPRRIGVVTSTRGAAIHDIISTIHRRLPTPILIADAAVQGATAPHQIVMGMAMVVRAGVDVVIVGRGGGAATDLSAFNHERVVRTIARCPVPVISAVGHEVDLSLADLAADARASTPTAAAELAVVDGRVLGDAFAKQRRRLEREIAHALGRARQDLDRTVFRLHGQRERAFGAMRNQLRELEHRLAIQHPRARLLADRKSLGGLAERLAAVHPGPALARARRALETASSRADQAIGRELASHRAELARIGAQLAALSPLAVLDRGYAMVRSGDRLVRDADEVDIGSELRVQLARGELEVVVARKEGSS